MAVASGPESYISVGVGPYCVGTTGYGGGPSEKVSFMLGEPSQGFCGRPLCPELALGYNLPPIRLKESGLLAGAAVVDAAELRDCAAAVIEQQPDLCGYVLMTKSPGCGLPRVARYHDVDAIGAAAGIFATALRAGDPLLPLEESDRLREQDLRESFVARVCTYYEWRQLRREGLSHARLQTFYAQRKYLIMSRDIAAYKQLGKLLATAAKDSLPAVAGQTITSIMAALSRPATRGGNTNSLMHIRGYLKNRLSTNEQVELSASIEQYRQGSVPLTVPLTLLRQHFLQHPHCYIEQQLFMQC